MIHGKVSFIAATRDYFNDRKIEISELKALSTQDKQELRELLIAEGYDVDELGSTPPQAT
jgi:hypothetical protein